MTSMMRSCKTKAQQVAWAKRELAKLDGIDRSAIKDEPWSSRKEQLDCIAELRSSLLTTLRRLGVCE